MWGSDLLFETARGSSREAGSVMRQDNASRINENYPAKDNG